MLYFRSKPGKEGGRLEAIIQEYKKPESIERSLKEKVHGVLKDRKNV